MDIQNLTLFATLAKTKSYPETAAQLQMSVTAVREQIHEFEDQLGAPLFEREVEAVRLTGSGQALYPAVQRLLVDYQRVEKQMHRLRNQRDHELYLITIPTMLNYAAFDRVTRFLREHPVVNARFRETTKHIFNPQNATDPGDIMFTRIFKDCKDDRFEYIPVDDDEYVLITAKDGQWAHRPDLTLKDVQDEPLYTLDQATGLYDGALKVCSQNGVQPREIRPQHRVDLILQAVRNGEGVGLLMRKSVVNRPSADVQVITAPHNIALGLCFIRPIGEHTAAADDLWQFLKRQYQG